MAQLGIYRKVVLNSAGEPVSGASVEVRRQGATVLGDQSLPTTINVNDPGGIVAGDVVNSNADTQTNRTVSSVTATTIVLGGLPIGSHSDDDRITVVSPLPTLYNDSQGVETKSNPLTTDSNGSVYCYIPGGKYDVKISGSGITTQLLSDEAVEGAESVVSNLYPSATGTASAFIFDTSRALSAGDNIISVRETGSQKFFVSESGNVMATGTLEVAGASTLGGAVLLQSTLAVASDAQVTGSLTVGGASTFSGVAAFNSVVTVNTNMTVSGFVSTPRFILGPTVQVTDGATQINANSGSYFATLNTGVTTISKIVNGSVGQLVIVEINDTFTYFEHATGFLNLQGSVDFHSSTRGSSLGFLVSDPSISNYEIFRSVK